MELLSSLCLSDGSSNVGLCHHLSLSSHHPLVLVKDGGVRGGFQFKKEGCSG